MSHAVDKKAALDAQRANMFLVEPEAFTLIYDEKHPLYDARVKLPVLESLVLSIMSDGVLEPVLAYKNGEELIPADGRQRIRAAVEANKRLAKDGMEPVRVPTVLKRAPEEKLLGIQITANSHRQDDPPTVRAELLARFLEYGRTEEEAKVKFGLPSIAAVKALRALNELAAPVRKAVDAGAVSPTAAASLAKLPREEQVKRLEKMATEGKKPTVRQVRDEVAGKGNAPKPPSRREIARLQAFFAKITEKAHPHAAEVAVRDFLSWVTTGVRSRAVDEAVEAMEAQHTKDVIERQAAAEAAA